MPPFDARRGAEAGFPPFPLFQSRSGSIILLNSL
jgi:hypothetical protein